MRSQKLRDAALLLPVIAVFLLLPAVLRLISGGHWLAELPSLPTFLYLAWFVLIVVAGLLSRLLLNAEARVESARSTALGVDGDGQP